MTGDQTSVLQQELRRRNLAFSDKTVNYDAIINAPFINAFSKNIRRVKTDAVQAFTWPNFLAEDACDELVALIDRNVRRSTVVGDKVGGPRERFDPRRTSSSCDLHYSFAPIVKIIDRQMSDSIGFDLSHSDPIQAQKYALTEEYQPHHDYFEPGTPGYQNYCAEKGQRTWTFMVYLSDVAKGGGTIFPAINRTFKPRRGTALIWCNLLPNGAVNPSTLHGGAPVKAGAKYIITKWYRTREWR